MASKNAKQVENIVKELYTKYTYPKYNEYMDQFAPIPHQYSIGIFPEQINHYIYFLATT